MRNLMALSRVFFCVCAIGVARAEKVSLELMPEAAKQPAAEAALKSQLKELAAELLSQRLDVLDIRYIEPDATNEKGGWGINYEWDVAKDDTRVGEADGRWSINRLNYEFAVKGAYAFRDTVNNQDLSTAKAAIRLERGDLGKLTLIPKESATALFKCLEALPADVPAEAPATAENEDAQRKIDEEEMQCWVANGIDRVVRDEPGGYYYWLDFHGGVEGNQDYSDTHTLFGLGSALAWQPNARSDRYNVFDLPFRLLRQSFGDASRYVAPLPSVLLSIERLDAGSDEQRSVLTTDHTFTRASGEAAFQTIIANFGGRPLRFNASYRYFHELSAPEAVKAVGLESFDFLRMSLRFPARLLPVFPSDDYELFVSYTSGKLPFDQVSGKALEIGFATNVEMLGKLLSR